ncbi:1-acyl-sn-glycerol-3-phosphate acyltransferase [Roseivirga misakiensis]|uniref:Glycerol-3-phosphate acyltransferase n=1 Tax=Roseivirga misakiensis TaxID=1563681 RepID=A0A1E5T291_9BACT|nr:1-acyl-sn-glycerol-3-phosphate acyltransferase [Roseivirga misakiensis]OEK05494.1 acyltransferase [Roseivirga misakiensis]
MSQDYVKKKYDPVVPGGINEWPVVALSRNRQEFVEEVATESIKRIKAQAPTREALIEEIETTVFREKLRIKRNPWAVDPEDDQAFLNTVKDRLLDISLSDNDAEKDERLDSILNDMVLRYSDEIAGNFKKSRYRMARSIVTFGFARLLNASRARGFWSIFSTQYTLQDKINITGEVDNLRLLAKKGTIVMVPTHFSNLDSILIGWVINVLGLPAFIYGAGLNLFNIKIISYFLNSLGAYKVDRRKKNMLYLETLKSYSSLAIQRGCHSLFFPGGTRSRSGKIESRLKLGLLSTAIEAQRVNYQKGKRDAREKIFVVPVTLNYNFVLEAPSLIKQYLRLQGQERYYVENDEYSTSYKITAFLLKFFTKGSDISVSIGKAMDVLGNYVDENGQSYDQKGRTIDTQEYFTADGRIISQNDQREVEYTRMLSERIVEEYLKINKVFASHLVAYTAFIILKKRFKKLDLYNLLRLPEEDLIIPYEEFKASFKSVLAKVHKMYGEGKLSVSPHLAGDTDGIIKHGLKNVGMYHAKRPLIRNRAGDITTQDLNVLFYYHNRLTGYNLEKYV